MKIIDTFLFSEPHEADLLLLKLRLGTDRIDEWVAVENSFTFRGEHKGLHLHSIMQREEFRPFADRVKIISLRNKFNDVNNIKCPNAEKEKIAFTAEYSQRNAAYDYIVSRFSDKDYVIVSDVDEMLDFSTAERKLLLESCFRNVNGEPFRIRRFKFWYDFDNECPSVRWIPAQPVSLIRSERAYLWRSRELQGSYKFQTTSDIRAAFEYSYCFKADMIKRKLDTFSHVTDCDITHVERGLLCNHKATVETEGPGRSEYWFEKIEINEKNSPVFVVDNFHNLRTGCVDLEYKENRKKFYPARFS